MELPKVKVKPTVVEPRRMFIFSQAKVGKTSLMCQLPNSLIIDLEEGTSNYESSSIDVKAIATKEGKKQINVLGEIAAKLKEEASKGFQYDFIVIDTTTALEDIARSYATDMYKKTVAGKNFTGTDVVTDLPQGSGYEILRIAFKKIYDQFTGLASKCLILVGHVKNASINKEGKDLQARDIQLTGKLKTIVCQDADAIGYMYRNKETNENMLSFKTSEQDLATGARPEHLSGKEFVISTKKDGELITNWDLVFPSIKK